jgi:hypothetical protein
MLFSFVLIDLTTSATPDAMRPASVLQSIADAASEQVNKTFAAVFGGASAAFRVGSGPTDRATNEIAINFRDTLDVQGALAYHQVVGGVPDIEEGVDLFQTLTSGAESLSVGVTHEVLETLRDAGCNGWKDKQDGSGLTGAEECCDPVQNTCYPASNGVDVTNFVLPSYWTPGASAPFDQLGVMTSTTDLSNGYEIQAQAPTNETQAGPGEKAEAPEGKSEPELARVVHGKPFLKGAENLSELARKRKASKHSRTSRRGITI